MNKEEKEHANLKAISRRLLTALKNLTTRMNGYRDFTQEYEDAIAAIKEAERQS